MMKIHPLIFGMIVLAILWVIGPWIFIILNSELNLPVYIFGMFRLIGVLIISMGLVTALVASMTFLRFGKGTPAITKPPTELVIEGLYKITRNPIYVAHVMIFFGLFIVLGHLMLLVYAVLGAVGLHLYIVKHEEPILETRYGDNYLKYKNQVPRWIFF